MKKYTKNIIFIVVIGALVTYFSLKDNFSKIVVELLNINIWWILFACFLILISWLFKSLALFRFVRQFKKEYPLKKVFDLIVMTQFFNGVTPFASGGQPAGIYILKKEKIDAPTGTTIIFQNFITYELSLIFFALCAILLNYKYNIFSHIPFLGNIVAIGFGINILLIVGYALISYNNKIMKYFIRLIINIGTKLRIVKNKEKMIANWNRRLQKFHESTLNLRKNKADFIIGFIYNFIALCFHYIIPIIILYSIGDYTSVTIMNTLIASAYVMLIGSFIPTPGASGGIEYGFITFFGTFLTGHKLTAVMLLWRFVTYYFGLFMGAIFLAFYKEVKK